MKIGIKPEVERVARLLNIMNESEKATFMQLIDSIEKVTKEKRSHEATEETAKAD